MIRSLTLILSCAAVFGPLVALAQETNVQGLDKSSLQIIVRKNIFDPTRTGARAVARKAPRVESFTFCGGAFDGPRAAAFFSGAGAPRKPLKPGDTINGFKVGAVTFRSVELKPADGPSQTLAMGMSMRREENGPWKPTDQPAPAAEPSPPTAASGTSLPANVSANDGDVLKRLRAKREEN